ncbi:MAG: NYN domain-containing protein, partial [Acetobacteraceae bacterium]|nr:NYN domain-containing protein [Acetobacteraceae bacterium]
MEGGGWFKVAILIDYENIHWSLKENYGLVLPLERLIDALRQVGSGIGGVVLTQAYADFDNREFQGLQSELQRRGVETRHVFSKNYVNGTRKNAADVEMSLDADTAHKFWLKQVSLPVALAKRMITSKGSMD